MLPTRIYRGKAHNDQFEAYTDPDPRMVGWRKFKKGNFSFNRKDRHAGIEYFVEQLINSGTSFKEIYAIVENVENMREADPDNEWINSKNRVRMLAKLIRLASKRITLEGYDAGHPMLDAD